MARLLALVDANPLATLIGLLTHLELGSAAADRTTAIDLLVPSRMAGAAERLKELLARRGVRVQASVHRDSEWPAAAMAPRVEAMGNAEGKDLPVVDVSGCSTATALLSRHLLAGQVAKGSCTIRSYQARLGRDRVITLGRDDSPEVGAAVDIGAAPSRVTVRELLKLYNLAASESWPYEGVGKADWHSLVAAARALLAAFTDEGRDYGRFRQQLALGRQVEDQRLTIRDVPAKVRRAATLLEDRGMAGIRCARGGSVDILPPGDRNAGFFFAGGWLEILVADTLRRALPDREIEQNLRTYWGTRLTGHTPSAEIDAAFILENRLYLVSCKNECVPERIGRELHHLRALVAEYGGQAVRPILLSTEDLDKHKQERCAAYEIGWIAGQELLRLLRDGEADPRTFLRQVLAVTVSEPSPGVRE